MPIGSHKDQRDGLVVYRLTGQLHAMERLEVPEGAGVFRPWPCAALAHSHCNLAKGATRDISRWRHSSLPVVVSLLRAPVMLLTGCLTGLRGASQRRRRVLVAVMSRVPSSPRMTRIGWPRSRCRCVRAFAPPGERDRT